MAAPLVQQGAAATAARRRGRRAPGSAADPQWRVVMTQPHCLRRPWWAPWRRWCSCGIRRWPCPKVVSHPSGPQPPPPAKPGPPGSGQPVGATSNAGRWRKAGHTGNQRWWRHEL